MSVFEAISLMIGFATFIILFLRHLERK
ncbi:MAG: putative holin-like toxin [Syntrophomonadaceae bacterium]|nr:putative holin-like toxin [Syntrophomonadaceae bacterium]